MNPSSEPLLVFEDLQRQASGRMPGNMTVQQPGARVIDLECKHDVPITGQQDNIATRRVFEVKSVYEVVDLSFIWGLPLLTIPKHVIIEWLIRLFQEREIVAVEMHLKCVS